MATVVIHFAVSGGERLRKAFGFIILACSTVRILMAMVRDNGREVVCGLVVAVGYMRSLYGNGSSS